MHPCRTVDTPVGDPDHVYVKLGTTPPLVASVSAVALVLVLPDVVQMFDPFEHGAPCAKAAVDSARNRTTFINCLNTKAPKR